MCVLDSGCPSDGAKCGKVVYAAERVAAQGSVYHAACFRCTECNVKLGANWCLTPPPPTPPPFHHPQLAPPHCANWGIDARSANTPPRHPTLTPHPNTPTLTPHP